MKWKILLFFPSIVFGLKIDCNFETTTDWIGLPTTYYCNVKNSLNIDSKNVRNITAITGTHLYGKSSNDEMGIHIYNKSTKYFPKNIEKVFSNLIAIDLNYGKLLEIHQEDLKPFVNLKLIDFAYNDIEYLEKDLFKYNQKLVAIFMRENKISNIHSSIFDDLEGLNYLNLYENLCINNEMYNNRSSVLTIIQQVKFQCKSLEEQKSSCSGSEYEYATLNCEFNNQDYKFVGTIFSCYQNSTTNFQNPKNKINRIKISNSNTNSEIKGFLSNGLSGKFNYFPHNFGEFFPNLEGLKINGGRLKKIRQRDLASFKNLKYLDLDDNDIDTIEIDLFAFNSDLKLIWIEKNNLKHIEVESIKKLNNLQDLDLRPNCHERVEAKEQIQTALTKAGQTCPYTLAMAEKAIKEQNENSELKCFENKIKILSEEKLKTSSNEVAKLQQEIRDKKAEISNIKDTLQRAENQNSESNQINEKLEEKLRKLTAENQNLLHKLSDENSKVHGMEIEKIDIVSRTRDGNLNLRQRLSEQYNNTLDELHHQKIVNNFLLFVALPLICVITLINIAVYISCCVKTNEQEIDDKKENVEMRDVTNRVWMNELGNNLERF